MILADISFNVEKLVVYSKSRQIKFVTRYGIVGADDNMNREPYLRFLGSGASMGGVKYKWCLYSGKRHHNRIDLKAYCSGKFKIAGFHYYFNCKKDADFFYIRSFQCDN